MILPDFVSEYQRLFNAIRKVVPSSMKFYLVGGAVRDILLGRKIILPMNLAVLIMF